ncbi:hypothetical protein CRG98_023065 [Punica granatum]|uniref:Bifunctional inhibitor/plant lipid transfer protein/seed storage helical domain-containing protein n=1 Tax=Punica granatum TaxID=22663 RepID=A0A2I0JJU7_PUNGR|nr:hypothetical protein CRG98_023065 [Punica granatum]
MAITRRNELVTDLALAVVLAALLLFHGASAQSGCTSSLLGLTPCLSYVSGNSSTPSSTCCSRLAGIVQSQPQCLCLLFNGRASSSSYNINQTLALALPGACNVQTPPVSRNRVEDSSDHGYREHIRCEHKSEAVPLLHCLRPSIRSVSLGHFQILRFKNLKKIVTGNKPERMEQSEWDDFDEKALFAIQLCLTNNVLHETFRETMIYGRDNLTFEDLKGSLLSKDKLDNELGSSSKRMSKPRVWLLEEDGSLKAQIRMHDRVIRTLSYVKHVPNLKKHLISFGALDLNSCKIAIESNDMKGSTVTGAIAVSSCIIESDSTRLWHMRLRHMSEAGITV